MSIDKPVNVLIVDDNALYREAFRRALLLEHYEVCEAANADEAIEGMRTHAPDVVVTDLQMRTQREGLELIETIKASDPLMPVIMISAVGSFEEGALATKLGAAYVIHKSRIEEEMDNFFRTICRSYLESRKSREQLALIASARLDEGLKDGSGRIEAIRKLLGDPRVDAYVKSEAYDFIASVSEPELLRESESDLRQVSASDPGGEIYNAALGRLKDSIPAYDSLEEDSRKALTTAEYLYGLQEERDLLDFSRSIGFSYSFAVENEVRAKLKGKFTRMAANIANQQLIRNCIDSRTHQLEIGFQQSLLLAMRTRGVQITIDNVRHVLQGMLQRGDRFKPDGLKDAGILLLCFGRQYSFSKYGRTEAVNNPLRIKGLSDAEVVDLGCRLVALQYARNPYIHPEAKPMERLSILRAAVVECLKSISKLL